MVVSTTARKVPKYIVFSGLYFPVFGPEKTPYLDKLKRGAHVSVIIVIIPVLPLICFNLK